MTPAAAAARRGVVRLLDTSGGRVLCLAGVVDADTVEAFWRCYGLEPVRVDVVDARSVTALSASGRELVADVLEAAARRGQEVLLRPSEPVRWSLAGRPG